MKFAVTGGTGTFGRAFVPRVLSLGSERVVALARHEKEMFELENLVGKHPNFRPFIGDVRDAERLEMAFQGIDTVIHAAALKRIEQCERDPIEAVRTNVGGTINTVIAAMRAGVGRCVLLSTDKAVAPVNLYGATKLTAERVFVAANHIVGGRCKFAIARYGNIFGSRGSVIPVWREQLKRGERITVTAPDATRYFMTINNAVDLVLTLVESMQGGEIALPNLCGYRLGDLAEAFLADSPHERFRMRVTHLPSYEKLHETLDGQTDSSQNGLLTIAELREEIAKL